ncbi:DNA topoisomerase (plasmid) [Bradyrhizobium septentrionale]|uniref:DNA topoisomerase n=1 Tax=Bradyrhizobium septentrionale TaxID=1404411 RepID=A0A973WAR1_9BRAD|nr:MULTISPECIES: DNA topoisomerase [Bradyrhizobium]MCK7664892.1 DNA topoisomerase [Bradyrhizobium sp. 2S1]UGY20977.1 DNA topoisomerase [Bradyrhizobium septentrionale]
MPDQIVITEKTSQAKDVRAAVGSRYGDVLPAEGHLFDLLEPEDVVPVWKCWSPILLRPEGLYDTRPATGGNKAAKLKAIREALRSAKRVWLATDCDREGQLIGQEILEHYKYRGEVMRVLFTAQDPQTIRDAFGRAKPNAEYARLYAAAVARRQADQIYNLSLTRTATVILGRGTRRVIGVGRVKTPTLAIVCKRELEIRDFVPLTYFEVVVTAKVAEGQFQMRHAPQDRIVRHEIAEDAVKAAEGFEGTLAVRVEDKRQGPPKLHDLPSLQKLCGSRFGWSASKTLEVAQELYDGQGKKIITYPRAEVRYLPQSLISDVPRIVAGLQAGQSFSAIPVPVPPVIRRGASGTFYDKGLEGASHHAVIPNVNTIDQLRDVWPRLSADEKKLFDIIARAYLAALMPDFRYRQTTATLDVRGFEFRAAGRQPIDLGWRAAFPEWQPADEKGDDAQLLPPLRNGETAMLQDPKIEAKETRPPPRYNEGTLIEAMQNAWRFVDDEVLRDRLKEAKGIGTPATRAEIIGGLKKQGFLIAQGKHIVPTEAGLSLFGILKQADPALVDPGVTAQLECLLDDVVVGKQEMVGAIDAVCDVAERIIGKLKEGAAAGGPPLLGASVGNGAAAYPPTPAMKRFADSLARQSGIKPPPGYKTSISICGAFLKQHAPKKTDGEATGKLEPKSVSPAQLLYAKKIALGKGVVIPDEAKGNSAAMAAWIDSNKGTRRRKSGRKTAFRPPGSIAPQSTAPRKIARKRKAAAAADASMPAQPNPAAGTPLRIPYGNKEIAMKLGARYGSGGWYAPPGVDLAAFGERGWL